jgi:IS6 family transposase
MRPHRLRSAPIARSAFARFYFPPDVIVLAVRWYLRFGLSYRDIEELLAERGIEVDHTTIYRWGAALHAAAGRRRTAAAPCHRGTLGGR